jgi:phosphatidylglycerol:prolipoprotein diacylglycerol transferase
MLAALVCGGYLLKRSQGDLRLSAEQRLGLAMGAFIGAMLGAKLPFVLVDWTGMLDGTAWFSSGKTIVCGMVGAYFGVEFAKWLLSIHVKTGDTFVVPAAVTIAIGRLSCLAAGCCYGTPSDLPWAMRCAPGDSLRRHPTQIYESLFHASMALLMVNMQRHGIWRGNLAKFYIVCYLLYRFVTETIRPEAVYAWRLTGYQWLALVFIPIFLILWWRDARPTRLV